jgi:hypothetical protein
MTDPLEDIAPETVEATALIQQTSALFAGKHPALVGPALASLMATWLWGHVAIDRDSKMVDAKETKRMREQVLKIQLKAIWQFIELNDSIREEEGQKPQ